MASSTIQTINPDVMRQNHTRTNDIQASAVSVTSPTIFEGNGSSYTGTIPHANYGYGVFFVIPRGGDRFVLALCSLGIATCHYNGSSWTAWKTTTWS